MTDLYDDYQIIQEELSSNIDLPSWFFRIVATLISITANSGLILLLFWIIPGVNLNQITIPLAFVFGLIIFILGIIGGAFWELTGRIIARSFYAAYLPEIKNNTISKMYRKFIDEDNNVFIEARSKDHRLKNPFSLFNLIFRISISELSFYLFITAFIVNPLISPLRNNIVIYDRYYQILDPFVALAISVVILAFYLPMSFILDDANIRTFNTDKRVIDTPGRKIRSVLDGIVGIGALSSGYSLFQELRQNLADQSFIISGSSTVFVTIDYIIWLIFIMIISWPLIFPASLFFFIRYQKIVNSFRTKAIKDGIPLGVSRIRAPYDDEYQVVKDYLNN